MKNLIPLILFAVFILLPGLLPELQWVRTLLGDDGFVAFTALVDDFQSPVYGVLQWPSVYFIGGSAVVLLWGGLRSPQTLARRDALRSASSQLHALANRPAKERHAEIWPLCAQHDLLRAVLEAHLQVQTEGHLRAVLDDRLRDIRSRLARCHEILVSAATSLPMLGMIGTIAGLMFMFSQSTMGAEVAEDAVRQKFAGMAVALLTTLYAAAITVFVVKPRYQSLEASIRELDDAADQLVNAVFQTMPRFEPDLLMASRPVE